MKKQKIELRLWFTGRSWWLLLRPSVRRWKKQAEKELSETLDAQFMRVAKAAVTGSKIIKPGDRQYTPEMLKDIQTKQAGGQHE